jgi:aquaporin Z
VVSPARFELKITYFQEAAGLGIFMFLACLGSAALEAPNSGLHSALGDPTLRRILMGMLMGSTACCLIYSPMGRNSGAHYNPAVTLSFLRLGKILPGDAIAYVLAQCLGGLAGVYLAWALLGPLLALPQVHFIVTSPRPGPHGVAVAFLNELGMTFVQMTAIQLCLNRPRLNPYTGLIAASILALEVAFLSPYSGTSLNPARSLASALPARDFTAWWIYLSAPLLGMLGATEISYRFFGGNHGHGL